MSPNCPADDNIEKESKVVPNSESHASHDSGEDCLKALGLSKTVEYSRATAVTILSRHRGANLFTSARE